MHLETKAVRIDAPGTRKSSQVGGSSSFLDDRAQRRIHADEELDPNQKECEWSSF